MFRKPRRDDRFYDWLLLQVERDDQTGDLARDVKEDTDFPKRAIRIRTFRNHLRAQGACPEAIETLDHAFWNEYIHRLRPVTLQG